MNLTIYTWGNCKYMKKWKGEFLPLTPEHFLNNKGVISYFITGISWIEEKLLGVENCYFTRVTQIESRGEIDRIHGYFLFHPGDFHKVEIWFWKSTPKIIRGGKLRFHPGTFGVDFWNFFLCMFEPDFRNPTLRENNFDCFGAHFSYFWDP